MKVRYDSVETRYKGLMEAEYEKCNIWPESDDAEFGLKVLNGEVSEVSNASLDLKDYVDNIIGAPDEYETGEIRAYAIETILEALQVISVCDKYASLFSKASELYDKD